MFVGYEIKSNQNQAKPITLTTDIRLSQAVLDPASKGNKKEPVCLMVEYNKKQFILAVLDPNQTWQSALDLMFAAGTEVKFFLRGQGTVHLTGYEHFDDLDDMSMSMSSDEEIEEDSSEEVMEPAKKKIKEKAGSAKKASPAKTNGVAKTNGKKNGKLPQAAGDEAEDDDDDDSSEDLDFDEDDLDSDDDDDIEDGDDDEGDDDDDDDDDLDEDMMEELDDEDDDEESD